MPVISEKAYAYAQAAFEDYLLNVFDDPSHMVHPQETETPAQQIAELRELCSGLGLDWDTIAAKAHDHERERLYAWEREDPRTKR